jgi:ABC-type multidrug transport system ATPase subunit/pSer/pThr/pTyr-binding forkhead associated (FHA) protein
MAQTLSLKRAEIDDRDTTFRIVPPNGAPYTVILAKRALTVGRDVDQDIRIDVEGVAPRHTRMLSEGANYRMFDVTPHKGMLVNGKPTDSALLRDGDTIRLQDVHGNGVNISYSNPAERAMSSSSAGQLYPFTDKFPFVIGRAPDSGVKLEALSISWRHARIDQVSNGHSLTDLNSENGTYVNDRPVKGTVTLHADDVIRIDKILLVYNKQGLQRLPSVQQFQIDGRDMEMTYTSGFIRKKSNNTMRNVSISVQPKNLVAIIGGSGSGKSTLLRTLNGAARATKGQITVNGLDLYDNYPVFQPVIGYVPQSDIVQNNLSVRQVLTFAARLRFPNEPAESYTERIDRALDDVELKDFQHNLVKNLSGGQKKRVSIALELMAEPGILFMDEPSSGLDPGLDKAMMDLLRKLSYQGQVIMVVTHTTLNIDQCDRLALMARGNLVYYGPPKESLTFFGVKGYPEIYNRVQNPITPLPAGQTISSNEASKQWAEKYRQSPIYTESVTKKLLQPAQSTPSAALATKRLSGRRRGTFWQQTRVLAERTWTLVRRDLRTMLAMLLVLPLVGMFLSMISYDTIFGIRGQMLVSRGDEKTLRIDVLDKLPVLPVNTRAVAADPEARPAAASPVRGMATYAPANEAQRLLFMAALSVVLLGLFTAAYTIVEERTLFLRERMVNLRIAPYLASKLLVYGSLSLVACLLFVITLAIGVRLPDQGMFLWGPLELYITLALTSLVGVALGLLISVSTDKIDTATYAVLIVLLIQILFPGVLFKMDGVLKPLAQITVTRWSLEALGGTINMNQRNAEGRIVIQSLPVRNGVVLESAPLGTQVYPSPSALNLDYPDDFGGIALRWGVLILFTSGLMVAAGVVLDRSEPF